MVEAEREKPHTRKKKYIIAEESRCKRVEGKKNQ